MRGERQLYCTANTRENGTVRSRTCKKLAGDGGGRREGVENGGQQKSKKRAKRGEQARQFKTARCRCLA